MKEGESIKEFLYIGHYYDILGRYILKIGTTNDINRRKKEHERKYKVIREYTMPQDGEFIIDGIIKLSHANTLLYEERNKKAWRENPQWTYIRNDRFYCPVKPASVQVKIRKVYTFYL